jgi:hypothetical protein
MDDYVSGHMAPTDPQENASLEDLSSLVDDIYIRTSNYGTGITPLEMEEVHVAMNLGRQSSTVTIYRAAPNSVDRVNYGDWVTTSRSYAQRHLEAHLGGSGIVLECEVPASLVLWDGNDLREYGYAGPPVEAISPSVNVCEEPFRATLSGGHWIETEFIGSIADRNHYRYTIGIGDQLLASVTNLEDGVGSAIDTIRATILVGSFLGAYAEKNEEAQSLFPWPITPAQAQGIADELQTIFLWDVIVHPDTSSDLLRYIASAQYLKGDFVEELRAMAQDRLVERQISRGHARSAPSTVRGF